MLDRKQQFFRAGGTLPPGSASYVVRKADHELIHALRTGEYCYVLNSRQMGKSSMCVRARQVLRVENIRVAYLDLTRFGNRNITPSQWYLALASELGAAIDMRSEMLSFWEQQTQYSPMQRFFRAIEHVALVADDRPLLVFLDEIDMTRSLPFRCDDFFAAIREAYNRRCDSPNLARLGFCLVGAVSPSDLCSDPSTTPFNVGKRISLSDFTLAEAQVLESGLGSRGPKMIRRILHWTNGHPYLTQLIGSELLAHPERSVDEIVDHLFFSRSQLDIDPNLDDVKYRLLNSEQEGMDHAEFRANVLGLYSKILRRTARVRYSEADPAAACLTMAGVARADDGILRVRNRIYRRVLDRAWIEANMPDGELRRRKAAARNAALVTSLIASVVIACVGGLAWSLQTNLRRADRLARERSQALAEARRANADLTKSANALRQETGVAQHSLNGLHVEQAKTNEAMKTAQASKDSAVRSQKTATEALADERTQLSNSNRSQYVASMRLVQLYASHNQYAQAARIVDEDATSPFRGWEWRYWNYILSRQQPEFGALAVAFSTDSKQFWTIGRDNALRRWSSRNGKLDSSAGAIKAVSRATFSPDRSRFLTMEISGLTHVIDIPTGKVIATFKTPLLGSASFSGDGSTVATTSDDNVLRVWDVRRSKQRCSIAEGSRTPLSFDLSRDGKEILASFADVPPASWDTASARPRTHFAIEAGEGPLVSVFSPDGHEVAILTPSKIYIFDHGSGRRLFSWDVAGATDAAYSPDGRCFVVVSDQAISRFDCRHWGPPTIADTRPFGKISAIAFDPRGRQLATGTLDGDVGIWDVASLKMIDERKGQREAVTKLQYSPDSRMIATFCADFSVRVWGTSIEPPVTLVGHGSANGSVLAFSPDSRALMTLDGDQSITLWAPDSGRALAHLSCDGPVLDAEFLPGQSKIAVASWSDRQVQVVDARAMTRSEPMPGIVGAVTDIDVSRDGGRILVTYGDRPPEVFDVHSGSRLFSLVPPPANGGRISLKAKFSPNGSIIVTHDGDGANRVWSADGGRLLRDLPVYRMSPGIPMRWDGGFSPDGNRLVLLSAMRSEIVDVNSGLSIYSADPPPEQPNALQRPDVHSPVFSPDGHKLVVCTEYGQGAIYDLDRRVLLCTLTGHGGGIACATFSPDGRRIATCGNDDAVRIWDSETGAELLTLTSGNSNSYKEILFSRDGEYLAATTRGGAAVIWKAPAAR